jgi:hypothetical protein
MIMGHTTVQENGVRFALKFGHAHVLQAWVAMLQDRLAGYAR